MPWFAVTECVWVWGDTEPWRQARVSGELSVSWLPAVSSRRCPFALWNPVQVFGWKPKWSMQKLDCKEAGNFSSPSEPQRLTCCYIQAEGGCESRLSRVCGPGTSLVNTFKACLFFFPGSVALDLWVDFFEFVSPTVHLFLTLVN